MISLLALTMALYPSEDLVCLLLGRAGFPVVRGRWPQTPDQVRHGSESMGLTMIWSGYGPDFLSARGVSSIVFWADLTPKNGHSPPKSRWIEWSRNFGGTVHVSFQLNESLEDEPVKARAILEDRWQKARSLARAFGTSLRLTAERDWTRARVLDTEPVTCHPTDVRRAILASGWNSWLPPLQYRSGWQMPVTVNGQTFMIADHPGEKYEPGCVALMTTIQRPDDTEIVKWIAENQPRIPDATWHARPGHRVVIRQKFDLKGGLPLREFRSQVAAFGSALAAIRSLEATPPSNPE